MADEPASPPSFDHLLVSLRQIVEKLETGALGLEDALKAFEEGVKLSRQCAALLDAAEHRVEILLRDPAHPGDPPKPQPFPDA
jgi:exodeoxyribonuclease VII small subunit